MAQTQAPEIRLAVRWFRLLHRGLSKDQRETKGALPRHQEEQRQWAETFRPLANRFDVEDLKAMMEWAMWVDTFWPTRLTHPQKVVDHVDTLMAQWRGWRMSEENKECESRRAKYNAGRREVETKQKNLLVERVSALSPCSVCHKRHVPSFVPGGPRGDFCIACHQEIVELWHQIITSIPLPVFEKK